MEEAKLAHFAIPSEDGLKVSSACTYEYTDPNDDFHTIYNAYPNAILLTEDEATELAGILRANRDFLKKVNNK